MLRASHKRTVWTPRLDQALPVYRPVQIHAPAPAFLSTGAGLNTKTSWTDFNATGPNFDADGFYLTLFGPSNTVGDNLLDFGLGNTGNAVDSTIISNLQYSGAAAFSQAVWFYVPLPIPKGKRLAWRFQSSDASMGITAQVKYMRGGVYSLMRRKRATTYGANTADSGGTSVDPGGSGGVKGSYVSLGSITSRHDYLIVCIGTQNNSARTVADHLFDIACGTTVWWPDQYIGQSAGSDTFHPAIVASWVRPMLVGTNLQVRQQSSITDATDRLADFTVIGID